MMDGDVDIAVPARALGDPARGRIAVALLGGRQMPATELARIAGVAPSTASEHFQVLLAAGLVEVEQHGRNRFYRLAGADVARAVEALQAVAPLVPVRSLNESRVSAHLRAGRTCYDHLGGDLGLRVTDLLLMAGLITALRVGDTSDAPNPLPDSPVTRAFELVPPNGRRPWVRGCLDWTGRRPHAAGHLGAHVLDTLISRRWITRRPGTRAVSLTAAGEEQLATLESGSAQSPTGRLPRRP